MRVLWVFLVCSLCLVSFASAFELKVSVPIRYLEVLPGKEVKFEISLKNIEGTGRKDIGLEYVLKRDGKVVMKTREVKAVETQASFLGTIAIPQSAKPGRYTLEVIVDNQKSAESTILVKGDRNYFTPLNLLISLVVAIFVVSLLILREVHVLLKRKVH